jgi:O-antigen/teichoic acid export membrane protein
MLGHLWGTTGVANLRAVQPTATMNEMVMASFATLFTPLAARLFAKDDRAGINHLYWRTAVWIAIFSFPMFAVTFCLARPITLLLFGARYEGAAPILAMLSLGSYFNAALGFNGLTLKVFGRVRYLVLINIATVLVSLSASALLIPRWGALGAGMATMIALIVHNLFKQAGLKLGTGIHLFEWRYLRVYLVIALCAASLLVIQLATSPPVYVGLPLAAVAALVVLLINRRMLEVDQMFPEARRVPVLAWLASGRRAKRGLRDLGPGGHPEPDPAVRP